MRGSAAPVILPKVDVPATLAPRRVEVRIVEQVKEVSAKLRAHPLADAEGFCKRPVEVEYPRRTQQVARAVAEGSGGRERKCSRVKPCAQQVGRRPVRWEVGIAHEVRAINAPELSATVPDNAVDGATCARTRD